MVSACKFAGCVMLQFLFWPLLFAGISSYNLFGDQQDDPQDPAVGPVSPDQGYAPTTDLFGPKSETGDPDETALFDADAYDQVIHGTAADDIRDAR